jgi:hypothetical protein
MTDNTRIRTNSLGVRIERIAVGTNINYRPADKSADVIFRGIEFMTSEDGETVIEAIGNEQYLSIPLSLIATKTYNAGVDPITGTDLSTVSPAGIAQIIKAVYDTEHNDKYAASEGTSNA